MTSDVFSEALIATARIACCVTLLGCPKAPLPATDTTAPVSEATEGASEAVEAEPACADKIGDFVASGAELVSAGDDIKQCCTDIIANTEIGDSREDFGACCQITGSMDGMCYPWGPPRPPEAEANASEAHDRAMRVRGAANGVGAGRVLDLRDAARAEAPAVAAGDGTLREVAITTWTGRMINEHESHHVFLALADRLAAAGVDAEEVDRCREFAREERRHGVLCGAVVEALGGDARAAAPDGGPMPLHAGVSAQEAVLRDLLSVCCLSETIAVALIGAERLEMPEGPLRELLTQIYADECGHANFGWRLLPTLLPDDPALKDRLGRYLRTALAHLEAHELAHIPARTAPAGGTALGLCSGHDARRLFYATVDQVILPALQAHGIDARGAWASRHAA